MGILAACGNNGESNGGNGGASATGGNTGNGGSGASGGSSASGGSNATGGATGSGGGSAGPVTLFDFASGDQGWVYNTYQATDSTSGAAVAPYNLVVAGNLSAGDLDAGVKAPTLAAESTVGDPPGSLKVVATFTGNNQQVNPNFNWGDQALQDWTNKTVSVRIKLDPAIATTSTGWGIQLFAQDSTWAGQYQWADFPTDSDWHTYTLNLAGATIDPTKVIQFTVQVSSPNVAASSDDGGVSSFTPVTVTAYIDTIKVQ
jgi:hypothetical protein